MITLSTLKIHGRISFGTTPVLPKILPVLALLLIALICIAIPVGAIDAQNSTANTTTHSVPVGNLTANETIANSTPTVCITSVATATPTSVSLAIIDNTTPVVQQQAPGNRSAESPRVSPVVTSTPQATISLQAGPTISGITPASGSNTTSVSITNLAGSNFVTGATVSLTPINPTPFLAGGIMNGTNGALLKGATGTYKVGNYVYVASYASNALEIVDVSNPANPVHAGSLQNGQGGAILNGANSVFVSGNYAYVPGYTSNALEIVNVANPAKPVHAGSLQNGVGGANLNSPTSVFVSGNYAYVADDFALEIVNVTNPAKPVHAGSLQNGAGGAILNGANSVFVSGNYAYLANYFNGGNALEIVDVSNPAKPVHAGSLQNGASGAMLNGANSVFVSGHYAYVASFRSNALEIVDVSNPANPVHAGSLQNGTGGAILNGANSVFVSGNYAYVTDNSAFGGSGNNTLEIVDVSNPAKPMHKGSIAGVAGNAPANGPNAVYVSGRYAYVAGQYANALEVVDIGAIGGTNVVVQSPTQITCSFNLTHSIAGKYNVVVTNPDGQMAVLQNGFTVTASPVNPSNVIAFGNTARITKQPTHTDYSRLGGASAIRRDGSLETFIGGRDLPGNDWIKVTNGAAITSNGELVTWTPSLITSKGVAANSVHATASSKKYVDISQFSDGDWLLAIYEDSNGQTHLEALGNYADHPEVLGKVPTGTGWMKISAGNNHALALKSDGTLVTWGKNDFGQLNLPANITYGHVKTGKDFSIGVSGNGTIYTSGIDTDNQVSGKPAGTGFIAVAAGSGTAAALTRNGTVVTWGRTLPGIAPPTGAGYTDLTLGPDYGFALRENVKEVQVTAPLSPSTTVRAVDGSEINIPAGSYFEHTHNDVTRVFGPDGTQILWANDENATQVRFPTGIAVPVSVLHYVPSGSNVDGTVDYRATVTNKNGVGGYGVVMSVKEDNWYDERNSSLPQTFPRAMCFANSCSAGITSKQQLFLSTPRTQSAGDIPVLSVHQLSDKSWVGTMSKLGSTNPGDATSIQMEKNNVDLDQPVYFSIVSSNWGSDPGANLLLAAKANLTRLDSNLHYTITGTASVPVPGMSITPKIWQKNETGDVLVFTGTPKTCSGSTTCIASGNFTPIGNATYFANATVLYSSGSTSTGRLGNGGYYAAAIAPVSATSEPLITALNVLALTAADFEYLSDAVLTDSTAGEKAMNYNSKNIDGDASWVRATINPLLVTDKILIINGHGKPGKVQVNEVHDEWYYAKNAPWLGYDFNSISSYENMNLAIFYACNSGTTDTSGDGYGNLVDVIGDKQGHCVMGWTDVIEAWETIDYNAEFWKQIQNSKTIVEAHNAAKEIVKSDDHCIKQHGDLPSIYNEYCNYDKLYKREKNQGCDLALPKGDGSQSIVQVNKNDVQLPFTLNEKAMNAIHQFAPIPVTDLQYTGMSHTSYADLYMFDAVHAFYLVNNITNRVQSVYWYEPVEKDQKENFDLDQGYAIAESFARVKYPEFWKTSDIRGTKVMTRNILDTGIERDLQFEWWEVYSAPDTNSSYSKIPGLNTVSVTVSPYTGHIIGYSEFYTPSVVSGEPPANLTPTLTENKAGIISETEFRKMSGYSNLTKPEFLNLRFTSDHNNTPHLTWNFGMTRTQKMGPKGDEFEFIERASVSVDAHDGTIVESIPFV